MSRLSRPRCAAAIAAAMLALPIAAGTANATILYSLRSTGATSSGTLVRYDTLTGAVSTVGSLGTNLDPTAYVDLAYHRSGGPGGTLWATIGRATEDISLARARLYNINPLTGQVRSSFDLTLDGLTVQAGRVGIASVGGAGGSAGLVAAVPGGLADLADDGTLTNFRSIGPSAGYMQLALDPLQFRGGPSGLVGAGAFFTGPRLYTVAGEPLSAARLGGNIFATGEVVGGLEAFGNVIWSASGADTPETFTIRTIDAATGVVLSTLGPTDGVGLRGLAVPAPTGALIVGGAGVLLCSSRRRRPPL